MIASIKIFKKKNPNIDENDLDNEKIQKLELFRAVSKIEKQLIDEILLIDKKVEEFNLLKEK